MRKNSLLLTLMLCLVFGSMSYGQWNETDKIVASDRMAGDFFGSYNAVSIHGDYAVVGSERADLPGLTDAGAAYIYKKDPNCNWVQVQKITADVPAASDYFGYSVAIYGDFIVVGSRNDDDDENDLNFMSGSGSAYIFQNIAGIWTQTQKIVASDRETGGAFGHDVDITARRIIVGAWGDDSGPGVPFVFNAGAAYVFEYNGVNWTQDQKLVASDRQAHDWFGASVAISYEYAIVGAYFEDHDASGSSALTNSGSAYIYEKTTGSWNQVQKVTSTDRGANEFFGWAVDIDGPYAIVGAFSDYQDENGVNPLTAAGSAFIFKRTGTSTWAVDTKLDASDRATGDRFGYSVGLTKGKAVVGAWFEDHNATGGAPLSYAGSAYIYDLSGGTWGQTQKIVASDRATSDRFGQSCAIYDESLIIGTAYEDEDDATPTPANTMADAGSAYIFQMNTQASQPTISASNTSFCPGASVTLTISSGNLNDAANWQWYAGTCNGTPIGTGTSITVTPGGTTTYYVNGVGGCVSPGLCGSITLSPNSISWHQTTQNTIGGRDVTNDVITDDNGNVYVTGSFVTQTTLNGGNNPNLTMNTGVGSQFASYIAKYNPCGDLLWEAHSIGSKDNVGNSITLNETDGIVYVAGDFVSNLNFVTSTACGGGVPTIYAAGGPKGYVAALKMANGCLITLDPVVQDVYTSAKAITIDETSGKIFVGGHSSPSSSGGVNTSYVHKYVPTGGGIGPIVSNIIANNGGIYNNTVNDMDYDEVYHRIWVIGDFEKKLEFLPGLGIVQVQYPGTTTQDAYLLAYFDNTTNFVPIYNRRGNATLFMSGEGISVDPNTGDPYFTGTFQDLVDMPFQFPSINNLPGFSGNNAYMIGYDLSTTNGWSRYGNVPFSHAYGKSVVFKDDYVYFTGNYNRNDITLQGIGNFPYVTGASPLANNHVFIACYKYNGNGVWGNVTTDPADNSGRHNAMSIAADNSGHAFVVGHYRKTMDYLSTIGLPQLNSTGAGDNGFVLRAETGSGDLFVVPDDIQTAEPTNTPQTISTISVSPNPTQGRAKYSIENFDNHKTYTVTIHDALGKVVYNSEVVRQSFYFDLSDQEAGIYFIQLFDGSQTSYSKVIKTNQ